MAIETQQQYVGKTRAFLFAETQSERYMSWVRLGISFFYAGILIFSLLRGGIPAEVFNVQVAALIGLFLYSVFSLVWLQNRYIGYLIPYLFVVVDVSIISVIIATYLFSQQVSATLQGALFSVYFIALAFTAMHNSIVLSLFCTFLSAVGYSIVFLYTSSVVGAESTGGIGELIFRSSLLLIVGSLSGIISRNNAKTIEKVVSQEIRYQNLVHRLPEMLFTLDAEGGFLWSNRASYSVLGIPAKVIRGRKIENFIIPVEPDPQDSMRVPISKFYLAEEGFEGLILIKDFNGNRKYADCVIRPAQEDDEASWEGRMADTTDREIAVVQRQQMEKQVFEHIKMTSLGAMASGMAHDFNNILQTLSNIVDVVDGKSRDDETKKQMSVMSETLNDAKFLVSELLALGGKKPLEPKPIHIQDLLQKTVSHYRDQLGSSYQVVLHQPQEPLWIKGDPDYLRRIFQNLFGNARDAMGEEGVITIAVGTAKNNLDENQVVIRFADTGCGIPPHAVDRIFEPFFTTKTPGKGTGLGLALVQRIVKQHNGEILIEKTGRGGTTFFIEIPQSDSAEIDDDTREILRNRISTTVLLLDDDPKIRDILKFFIREFGYGVCEAATLEEARTELHEHVGECEVLITDWRLGREDPHRVINELRDIKPELIVIVVSGYPPQRRSIEEMNIRRWLTKPYDKNQLDFEIQKALHFAQKNKTASS